MGTVFQTHGPVVVWEGILVLIASWIGGVKPLNRQSQVQGEHTLSG